ncbi:hypothetical protein [Streptomyces sp. NPDC047974]|uniref:hypothetical protein n=1 Tax=Streptomyces sp. NPDC047974 TaxID=3154343 RepID=UPI0033E6BDA5
MKWLPAIRVTMSGRSRRPAHPNAVGRRDARFMLAVLTPLTGVSVVAAHAFQKRVFQDPEPWTSGRFLNFTGHDQRLQTRMPPRHVISYAPWRAMWSATRMRARSIVASKGTSC